jgi:hypothetical protein
MAFKTINEVIEFKEKIVRKIESSQEIMGLIADDPDFDINSAAAENVLEKNVFDYDYMDGTTQTATAMIMTEVEIPTVPTNTIRDVVIYIQIVVSKSFMDLGPEFKGVKGNRRDNLVSAVDKVMQEDRGFGIGPLEFKRLNIASVPDTYTSVMLTYETPNFN